MTREEAIETVVEWSQIAKRRRMRDHVRGFAILEAVLRGDKKYSRMQWAIMGARRFLKRLDGAKSAVRALRELFEIEVGEAHLEYQREVEAMKEKSHG